MIRKSSGGGYEVLSHSGKRLSRKGLTKKQAQKRLAQVEYFKRRGTVGEMMGR